MSMATTTSNDDGNDTTTTTTTTTTSQNELSLAISYYQLYASLTPQDLQETTSTTTSPANFWQDDEWSAQDESRAEKLLKEHESKCCVSTRRVQHYEREAAKNWNKFYQHHGTNFFKDRHYLDKAFPDEFGDSAESRNLVEIGCGVGNNILPLLEHKPNWKVWGYDLSKVAVDLMMQDARFDPARAHGGVWDISSGEEEDIPVQDMAHVCTLLFCLSAIAPEKMLLAAQNVAATLRPGGVLVLRDYGRYDEAQIKLGTSRAKRLGDNFYVKSDGTRCFYFSVEHLQKLFEEVGLEVLELKYIRRIYQNRAQDQQRRRVWVQGRFRKPPS